MTDPRHFITLSMDSRQSEATYTMNFALFTTFRQHENSMSNCGPET